mgnify:CR=1 FL=1
MKRNLKIVLIKEVDFMRAWIKLLEHCIRNENLIPFGSKDDPKAIRGEVCSRVVLEQSAVKQVLDGINYLPKYGKLFPFGARFIEHYVNEYTLQYIEEQAMLGKEDKRKFTYTYYDRFKRYPTSNGIIDQVDALRENLKKQIESNPAITKCGFRMVNEIKQNFDLLNSSQQKILAPLLQRPQMQKSIVTPKGYFRVHYDTTGVNAIGYNLTQFLQALDSAYTFEVIFLGYSV